MARRTKAAIDRTPEVETSAPAHRQVRAASRAGWQIWGALNHEELGWVKVAVHPNRVYNVLGEDRVGRLSEVETPGMVEIECTVTGVKLLVMPTDIEAV